MLRETLEKVGERWKLDGVRLALPPTKEELIEDFANLGILLSQDVIETYSSLGGFKEDALDSECLTFWTVKKKLWENERNAKYVFFADFLIDSHHCAFKYKNIENSMIYVCYSETDRYKISATFAAFFELYLEKIERLFI